MMTPDETEHKSPAELAMTIGVLAKAHRVAGIDVAAGIDQHLDAMRQRACLSPADALALVTYAHRFVEGVPAVADDPEKTAAVVEVASAFLLKVMAYLESATGIAHESFFANTEKVN